MSPLASLTVDHGTADNEKALCEFCWELVDLDELTPGPSGDPCCDDCHLTHADTRAAYAY